MKLNMKKWMLSLLFVAVFSAQALASDIATYKAQGLIGERPNGLVGKVTATSNNDVDRLIREINEERLDKYRQVAQRNNLELDKVQALAGERLIRQTDSGHYIQTPSGSWVRK